MDQIAKSIIEGIGLGLIVCFSLGPVFFALIQTSIKNGFIAGMLLASGIVLSDFFYILIAYFGTYQFFSNPNNQKVIAFIGGCVLIAFGIVSIAKNVNFISSDVKLIKPRVYPTIILKGFFLNFINPILLFFWVAAVGIMTAKSQYSKHEVFIFFIATLGTIFATDILKAFIAGKIRKIMNQRLFSLLNRIVGIALITFGIMLILEIFFPSLKDIQ